MGKILDKSFIKINLFIKNLDTYQDREEGIYIQSASYIKLKASL